jgi:uncharacterized RDD family membrane protein YckC
MQTAKPNLGLRIASMFIDHFIMCFIILVPFWAFVLMEMNEGGAVPEGGGRSYQLLFIALMVVYFLKDSFRGRSIAKRILKLQVVRNDSNEAASPARCFVRNIFIILWPIEVIATLFNSQRRIGDRVAGTRVISIDEKRK